jgi:hypothetical protein
MVTSAILGTLSDDSPDTSTGGGVDTASVLGGRDSVVLRITFFSDESFAVFVSNGG